MALFIRQNEKRSELQNKLAAELQERARQKAAEQDLPDGVTDSAFVRNSKQGTRLTGVWVIIALLVMAGVVVLIISSL